MIHPASILVLLLFAAPVAAQEPTTNYFATYPDFAVPENCTQFASRSDLSTGAGEILQAGLGAWNFAVGDYNRGGGPRGYISGFYSRIQDQNLATREMIRFVLRKADSSGTSPDPTPAGLVYQSQLLPHRGLGAVDISFALGTPLTYDHAVQHFFGVWLPAAPNWPADGLSMLYADDRLGTLGDNPRANAPGHIYTVTGTDGGPTSDRGSFRAAVTTAGPVARAGGKDPGNTRQLPAFSTNYGRGGVWVDVDNFNGSGRYDNLVLGGRGPAGGLFAAFLAIDRSPALPMPFPADGALRLPLGAIVGLSPMVIPISGKVEIDLPLGSPTNPVRRALAVQDLYAQFLTVDQQGFGRFSSVAVWRTNQTSQ